MFPSQKNGVEGVWGPFFGQKRGKSRFDQKIDIFSFFSKKPCYFGFFRRARGPKIFQMMLYRSGFVRNMFPSKKMGLTGFGDDF